MICITNKTNSIYFRSYCQIKGFTDTPLPQKVFSARWKYLKSYTKQKASKQKAFQKGTGGGPSGQPLSIIEEQILSVANHEVEVSSKYNSELAQIRQSDILLESMRAIGLDYMDLDVPDGVSDIPIR